MNSMKKINAYMQLLLLSVVLLSISCTGDFENMNRNPNEVTDGQMDALNYKIGTKFQSLQGLVVPVQEHMYQFNESLSGGPFGGYIGATVDSWLTKFETFNPSADWRKWPFANVITETYTPWRGIVTGTDDEVAVAFAKLLRVAIMHRVTDSYGPIPYSNLETNESITVKYDKQEEVYMKMFGGWTRRSPPSPPIRRFRPRLSAATTGSTAAISPSGSNMPIRSSCAWRCALAK